MTRQTPNRKHLFHSYRMELLLLMSLGIWGCFHASQVAGNKEIVTQSKIRPIDVEPLMAERIGQEALEKIGYDKIIELAEQAGFVESKSDERIHLASYGSVVASASMRVFSRYAFAAAVTSQADSPLPGPADIAAVGVLVIGLVDAGLLNGYLIKSIGKLIVSAGEATIPATVATDVPDDRSDCRDQVQPAHAGQWSEYETCDQQYEVDRKVCQKACTQSCWASAAERLAYCNRTKGAIGFPSLRA